MAQSRVFESATYSESEEMPNLFQFHQSHYRNFKAYYFVDVVQPFALSNTPQDGALQFLAELLCVRYCVERVI